MKTEKTKRKESKALFDGQHNTFGASQKKMI